jgi:selenoprotein W-related protein
VNKNKLEYAKIIPSSGGVFEVVLDGKLVFSKKELGRFPTDEEIKDLVNNV